MKRREREHHEQVGEAQEQLRDAAERVQYLSEEVVLSIIGDATLLLQALDPESHGVAMALAYAIGPLLDVETQEDPDVEQIATQQLLAGLLVLVTSLAADLHAYLVQNLPDEEVLN